MLASTPRPLPGRTALLSLLALSGFAGNSLLTRLALRPGLIDAASFTALRLSAGAVALVVLAQLRRPRASLGEGSWLSAILLFIYAAPFTYAYLRIGAAIGALVLFGVVQVTMIGWGLFRGERPRAGEWFGLLLAASGLVTLTLPGAKGPDFFSFLLMTVAGIAWGAYSLRGRGSKDPLGATAGNFTRATPLALVLALFAWLPAGHLAHASASGVAIALSSGALTSGVAYTFWYAALPGLSALRAALVQLAVPVLAAAAAVVLLDEPLTARLIGAGALVLSGVSCALWSRRSAPSKAGLTIETFQGARSELLPLFAEADDSSSEIQSYIALGDVLVARCSGQVVGHVQLIASGSECEIKSLAVLAGHRGQGTGAALARAALARAASAGASRVLVSTATADIDNLRFYQRLGFRMTSVDRDAFTAARGYSELEANGIPVLDRVWFSIDLEKR